MPLRNRKEEEVSQLKGVTLIESVDPSKLKLGMFERLSNMTFSGIGSIKRKRGVAALDGVVEPELTLNFQDNFIRDDCTEVVLPAALTDCVDCLTITATGSIIAKSAEATDPCFCFYGGQLCFNRVISIELEYVADTAGNGISGVTLAVPPTATALLFSGYGLVYTPGTLTLAKWTDASLATIETTLDTAALTLNPADVIKLTYDTTTGVLTGYVNDVAQVSATDITLQDTDNQGVGLIVVGNNGADDRAEWTNIFAECIPGGGGGGCAISAIVYTTGEFNPVFNAGLSFPDFRTVYTQETPFTIAATSGDNGNPCFGVSFFPAVRQWACSPCCGDGIGMNTQDELIKIPLADIIGTPRIGIIIQLNPDTANFDNVQGYGLIADFTDDTVKIVTWNNETLETYGADVLDSTAMNLWIDPATNAVIFNRFQAFAPAGANCNIGAPSGQITVIGGDPLNPITRSITTNFNLVTDTNYAAGFIVVGVVTANSIDSANIVMEPISTYAIRITNDAQSI